MLVCQWAERTPCSQLMRPHPEERYTGCEMHSDVKRYYAILELEPSASDDAIRTAFRRRAKELHPDSASGSTGAFIRLKRAYDTLSDPSSRADYDSACASHPKPARAHPKLRPASPRPRPRGSLGFFKYAFAMLFMAGLSFGAIELMISFAEAPPPPARITPTPGLGPNRSDSARTAAQDGPGADSRAAGEERGRLTSPWDEPDTRPGARRLRREPSSQLGAPPSRW